MTVEMRHLRAFLAIAEEQNLTRAAATLHISQPALSRTLAQLERDLAVSLVDRSTHHLALTEAGRHFERLAFDAVRAFEVAITGVDGHTAPLRLGHSWSAGIHLAALLRAWGSAERSCELNVVRKDDRTAGLSSGAVDAALTRGPLDTQRYRSIAIDREDRMAVLHRSHPLAKASRLTLEQLSAEGLVVAREGTTTPALWPERSRPSVVAEADNVDDWLIAIASGLGFGVTVTSTARLHRHPDVRYVPLTDTPPQPLLLAWPHRLAHPAIGELRRVITTRFR